MSDRVERFRQQAERRKGQTELDETRRVVSVGWKLANRITMTEFEIEQSTRPERLADTVYVAILRSMKHTIEDRLAEMGEAA